VGSHFHGLPGGSRNVPPMQGTGSTAGGLDGLLAGGTEIQPASSSAMHRLERIAAPSQIRCALSFTAAPSRLGCDSQHTSLFHEHFVGVLTGLVAEHVIRKCERRIVEELHRHDLLSRGHLLQLNLDMRIAEASSTALVQKIDPSLLRTSLIRTSLSVYCFDPAAIGGSFALAVEAAIT